jgi:hypothetical protein
VVESIGVVCVLSVIGVLDGASCFAMANAYPLQFELYKGLARQGSAV